MTRRLYVPTSGPESWKLLLAQPDLHWKQGYSAMSVAQAWEHSGDCLPPEVASLFESSGVDELRGLELLLAIPEYKVAIPGGSRASQTDVFALARNGTGLVTIAVEGKVDEPFGPTVSGKRAEGAEERLAHLHTILGLDSALTADLRYQLFHRTAAALALAHRFHAPVAAMVVQSFSPSNRWREDFDAFVAATGSRPSGKDFYDAGDREGVRLFLGWASGDQRFRVGPAS
jgi:hypothetical protein